MTVLHTELAYNFTIKEVGKSQIAERMGIKNNPTLAIIDNARLLAIHVLQPIRDHFKVPFSPQSWYRSEELEKYLNWNKSTKSPFGKWCKKKSLPVNDASWAQYFALKSHPLGQAADIEIPGVPNDMLFEWIKNNLKFDQLIREFKRDNDPSSGWVHVSYRAEKNRQQVLTIS